MNEAKPGVTLPEICRSIGITRARGERVVFEYRDRLAACFRAGITRIWPSEAIEQVRAIIAEEDRARGWDK
ncbi:MAG: hypothetical protein AAB074_20120 [Planctomycetota bacterium]